MDRCDGLAQQEFCPFAGVTVITVSLDAALKAISASGVRMEPPNAGKRQPRKRDMDVQHGAAWGLLRHALTRCSKGVVAPSDWSFRVDEYGKPRVADGLPQIHFNMSHAHDCIAVALSQSDEIGIDIEPLEASCLDPIPDGISACEIAMLHGLPETQRVRQIIRLWTCKEAIVKATGQGVSCDLHGIDAMPLLTRESQAYRVGLEDQFFDVSMLEFSCGKMMYAMSVAIAAGCGPRFSDRDDDPLLQQHLN